MKVSIVLNDMDRTFFAGYGFRSWLLQDMDESYEVIINLFNDQKSYFDNLTAGANPNANIKICVYDRPAYFNISAANNLGITNYEAGTIDIVTNGNSGVFIDSSGNVGIKGATPTTALTVNGGAAISALTTGQIVFPTSGGTLAGSSNLFWDNTNGKLGVGTSTLSGARVTISSSSEANHLQLVSNAPAMTFINAISC